MPPPISFMHRRREFGRRTALALALGVAPLAAATADGAAARLMPLPAEIRLADGWLPVTRDFRVALHGRGDARVPAAVERMLRHWEKRTGWSFAAAPTAGAPADATLVITCARPGDAVPTLGEDESYTLEITPQRAVLRAPTTTGALRGLATVEQLLASAEGGFHLPAVRVRDRPRFPWRGLLIDVARHWEPVDVIERELDGMALVKLNVLHLHLTDDQGFRIESRTHPELPGRGSDGHFFTQAQMRAIIAYAAARGIRVVPEFDLPGHATSWVVSHPELASAPGPYAIERKWGVFDPVLDPTNEKLYALLDDFLGEMAALFPDDCIHIGGDENNGVQWNANPRIQAFIRAHGLKDNAGLHAWFNGRLAAILRRHGKRLVGWDEILHPGLPGDSIIESWRGPTALAEAAARGYAGILANGYYIDLNHPAAEHYLNDPLPADTQLTPAQQRRVLGGEATMWGEWVDPGDIDTRIWPRTAAIAERLWSLRGVRDVADMYRRLAIVDERLTEAGLEQDRPPRLDLPGLDPNGRIATALRTLADVVEPVQGYQRNDLQPGANQFTPLDELTDWARPDSATARGFDSAVNLWLFAAGELDPQKAAALANQLAAWRAAGELAAQAPAADTPVAQARGRVARSLAAVSVAGGEAIAALLAGEPLSPGQHTAAEAALAAAAQPTAAAVAFPELPALRLLVAAAQDPARREQVARDAWRKELESASLRP